MRKVLAEWSKMTARWVGWAELIGSRRSLLSMLQKPDTAPTGSPSDLRVRGGRA